MNTIGIQDHLHPTSGVLTDFLLLITLPSSSDLLTNLFIADLLGAFLHSKISVGIHAEL
jgi:hypothetical protein